MPTHKQRPLIRACYPQIPRRVSGYNLDELLPERGFNVARALVGSEGTCVTVLEAVLNLVHSSPARTLLVLGYPDVYHAGDHVPEILRYGPVGLEGLDRYLIEYLKKKHMHPEKRELLPEGHGWLLAEFGGDTLDEANAKANGNGARAGIASDPPRLGGCGRAAGQSRGLSARVPRPVEELRLCLLALRPFRRRLHPRAHRLRSGERSGRQAMAPLHE